MRLQLQRRVLADVGEVVGVERGLFLGVEGFDMRPFEAHHVAGQLSVGTDEIRVKLEPGFEARTEVAQRERLRGTFCQVGAHQRVEFGSADNGLEAGEILFEAGVETEPVLPVVNFEALEGGEAVVGANDRVGFSEVGGAIAPAARHGFRAGERMHDGGGHAALDLFEAGGQRGRRTHRDPPVTTSSRSAFSLISPVAAASTAAMLVSAAASAATLRNLFALRASAWTSSKLGMLSSHSRSV